MAALRKDQQLLLWAAGASVLLWPMPLGRLALAPLIYLNTHLHELCHALAGLLTGGSVDIIRVNANFSGEALVAGGSLPIVASAGYVGASLIGGVLILCGRKEELARAALWTLFGFLLFSMVFFVRGDLVGVLTGLAWLAGLFLLAGKLKGPGLIFTAQFIGIQQCLSSLVAFVSLLGVSLGYGHSDAKIMESATAIPAIVWASLWLALSGAIMAGCLSHSLKQDKPA